MSFYGYTIKEMKEKLNKGEMSVLDLVETSYDRIEEVDDVIKAFLTLNKEAARKEAQILDALPSDKRGKLFGLPVGIKDNIMTNGLRTTCGSKFLENFENPLFDATVVEKLKNEQAITIGKMNMDEFAMGSTSENSSYQVTRNPWNTDYIPGGSSGGSAASVAAGEVLFALGSDTGGSVRQPAAYSGIVGMKPTYGRVSRYGLVAFASSLDQIGPLTHSVEDNAYILETIAGHDSRDATSAKLPVPAYTDTIKQGVKGLRIAIPQEYLGDGVSEEVSEAVMNAAKMFELLGAKVEKVSLPHSDYAGAAYSVISSAEASTGLARFDGVRFGVRAENTTNMIDMMKQSRAQGFGEEVKKRIIFGSYVLSAGHYETYFEKAQKIRTLIKREFETIFKTYDLIIGPTSATTAYKVGDKSVDTRVSQMNDQLTVPANLAGIPALSIPCGFTEEEGLPIGLQMMGNHFAEELIYQAAYAYENATNHHKKRPVLEGDSK